MYRKLTVLLAVMPIFSQIFAFTGFVGETDRNPLSYKIGEEIVFRIDLLKDGKPLEGKRLRYFIDTDDGKKIRGGAVSGRTLVLKTTLSKPGFVRVRVYPHHENGDLLKGIREFDGGAAADIGSIKAAEPPPAGMDKFWDTWRAKLAAAPFTPKLTLVGKADDKVLSFEYEIPTLPGMMPATGFIAYPNHAAPKSLGACVEFEGYSPPAAAWNPRSRASSGIVIRVNRYGIPNQKDKTFYRSLDPQFKRFGFRNNQKPETSDFLGLFLRALRSVQLAKSQPSFNGNLSVAGGSMGAFQALGAAALDPDITACNITIPWCCDLAGVRHGRIKGWRPDPDAGVFFFDPVNLAKRIHCPVTIRAGLGDYVSPPSGITALYNELTGPAQLTFVQNMKHGTGQHPDAGEFTMRKNQPPFAPVQRKLHKVAGFPDLRTLGWKTSDSLCFTEKRDGKTIFIVNVPKGQERGSHWFRAVFDPAPFRGKSVCFLVRFRTKGVSKPPKIYLGSKFMISASDGPGSKKKFYDAWLPEGDNDWQYGSIFQSFSPKAKTTDIVLGLQDVSGRIEFELDSLECGALYTPENRKNLNYKIKYPESVRNTRLRGIMSPAAPMNEDMLRTLNSWNVNLVRYQLMRNWGRMNTELDLKEYNAWLDRRLDNFEKMTKLSARYGIRFILDMHSPPGGKSGWYQMRMFSEKKYTDAFVDCWKKIAARFKGNRGVFAYDLINEPFQSLPLGTGYLKLQQRAAEAIREIDPSATVIISPNEGGGWHGFSYLSALPMDNVIYQVHFYEPPEYTHQPSGKNISYPGMISGVLWNRDTIRGKLQIVRDFQMRHDAVIYVGEFSANVWAPGAEKWLTDCISVFEEYGWLWSFHAFREYKGWSVEHDGTGPGDLHEAPNTKRKQALLKGFELNNNKNK